MLALKKPAKANNKPREILVVQKCHSLQLRFLLQHYRSSDNICLCILLQYSI